MKTETIPFDAARYITDDEARVTYLREAFATGDVDHIADALGTVARAIGMTEVTKETGLARGTLYKALAKTGNPTLETLLVVLKSYGLSLSVEPAKAC